jgi:hypothetical protein
MKDNRQNLTTKLAYIAGFIDGEGCIRIKKSNQSSNSYYITLQVTNSDPKPLELIKKYFEGKVYFQEKTKNKVIWQYYVTCNEAVDALRTLVGFLITKKPQADAAIYFHDNQAFMTPEEKKSNYQIVRDMKKQTIIGNIYENPELLESNT